MVEKIIYAWMKNIFLMPDKFSQQAAALYKKVN